ncbi:MAG: uroporphyrinogen decarboxylase family protein [Planctomycetota bacterium]
MTETSVEPLPKDEVVKAIERRDPRRIPLVMAKWWGEGLDDQYGERLRELDRYPHDVVMAMKGPVDFNALDLSWRREDEAEKRGHDSGGVLPDWEHLDELIDKLPDPEAPGLLDDLTPAAEQAHQMGRYVLYGFWGLFFERPWGLRGMANLMMDYYLHPDEVHRLHDALCTLYVGLIRRAARELAPDGFWTSDDLGNQRQLMMRPEHFHEFLYPYYCRVAAACREAGVHFWLHSCGNNTDALPDLIDAGVQIFHPVQKHTMDEQAIARDFGDRLTFLVGFDVQHLLREGTPDAVRAEVRYLIDTFDRPDGGMCLAAGNGIVGGTPFENIEAFLDEAVLYGRAHRSGY